MKISILKKLKFAFHKLHIKPCATIITLLQKTPKISTHSLEIWSLPAKLSNLFCNYTEASKFFLQSKDAFINMKQK